MRRWRKQLGRSRITLALFGVVFVALWPLMLPIAVIETSVATGGF